MKDKTKVILKKIVFAVLSGILISLSLNPRLNLFSWFVLVPLIIALDKEKFWKSCLFGLTTGFIFSFFLTRWIASYTQAGFFIALVYAVSFITIISIIISYFSRKMDNTALKIIVIALSWLGLQLLYSLNSFGSYFADIGYFQNIYLLQLASFTGIAGLTFLVILTNAAIAFLIINKD